MVRKHVKVEPARWYTHCDQLGLIVWQDMPNGGPSPQWQARNYFNGTEAVSYTHLDVYKRQHPTRIATLAAELNPIKK